jgi:4-amino-4-deoxy-L-arabinose transferase-like glycosyltransferase
VAVATVAWALLTPPFLVPDEPEHFAYVQSLAENGERPPHGTVNDSGARRLSSEETAALYFTRTEFHIALPDHRPAWEPSAERGWERYGAGAPPGDATAIGPQAHHPPLYYAFETAPYLAGGGGDLFDRLLLMRLWSGLLLLVTTTGAWLLIGELTGRDRLLQLAGAACVGLQPMATFVSAGVNPDAMLFAAYSIALWLAVRLLRRGPSRGTVAGLFAVTLAAVFSKSAGFALVPGVALVLLLLARSHARRGLAAAGTVAGLAVLTVVGFLAVPGVEQRAPVDLHPDRLRAFSTYLWDFYLPRLPFQEKYAALHIDNPAWTVWVEHAWASFGYLEVRFPAGVYVVLAGVALATFAGAALAVARSRFRPGRAVPALFGLIALCLVISLHWTDFQTVDGQTGRIMQGRYLLPLMPMVAVAVAAALSNFTRRRELAVALVLAGMAVLQLGSLAIVAGRYFA